LESCCATNNPHKLKEVRELRPERSKILSLSDIGCKQELPETAKTLEENSYMKAFFVHDKYEVDCFADDTGLEVEALNNRPGVYSARYAGLPSDSDKNITKLLNELGSSHNRRARFKTIITLIMHSEVFSFEGIVNGQILKERRGGQGFGYDPVFVPDGYAQTFAEMSLEQKNAISHRGIAIRKLVSHLLKIS